MVISINIFKFFKFNSLKTIFKQSEPEQSRIPPPIVPRSSERSPSPTKPEPKQKPQATHSAQSHAYENMYLGDYCLLTRQKIKSDDKIILNAKKSIEKFLAKQLDMIGIYAVSS